MVDKVSLISPLKSNDDIISEFLGHNFATIINGITLTVKYEKIWHKRIAAGILHAIVVHWFEKELSDINSDLFGKSIIKIYCVQKRKHPILCHPNYHRRGPWHDCVMVISVLSVISSSTAGNSDLDPHSGYGWVIYSGCSKFLLVAVVWAK